MMGETNWIPGLVVLAIGLVAGAVAMLRFMRSAPAPEKAEPERSNLDLERRDLEAQRDALIAQLRELEATGSKRQPDQLARDRYALELETAQVLMRLERIAGEERVATTAAAASSEATAAETASGAPAAQQPAAPKGFFASHPGLTGALWGGGVVGFIAALFIMVQDGSTSRAPGMSVTGNSDPSGAGQTMQAPPDHDFSVAGLRQRAESMPFNLDAQLDLAQALLFEDQLSEAYAITTRVLESRPNDARAITYQAIVRRSMGMVNQARQMLERAIAADPGETEAWLQRGVLAFETARYDTAVESFERVLMLRPDGREAIGPVLEQARALAGQ